MSVFLRIDVDNPYVPTSRLERLLNVLRNDLDELLPALPELGYLKSLASLHHELAARGVAATYFFRRSSVPTSPLVSEITRAGCSFGFHATRTSSKRSFLKDLRAVKKHVPGGSLRGFSKHGSGRLKLGSRHTREYDERGLLALGRGANLEYFSGNLEDPSIPASCRNGILYFPSAFWLRRERRQSPYDLEWLLAESGHRPVVCLVHPKDYTYYGNVRSLMEEMLGRAELFTTFDSLLDDRSMKTALQIPSRGADAE